MNFIVTRQGLGQARPNKITWKTRKSLRSEVPDGQEIFLALIHIVGLRYTLNELYDRYQIPRFVVENGLGQIDEPDENGIVHDDYRINYLRQHLMACLLYTSRCV